MPHRGVGIAEREQGPRDEHGEDDRVPGACLDEIHVAAVGPGGGGRRHSPVGGRADAADHRRIRDGDRVAPVNEPVSDRADVRPVRAVVAEPFAELLRVGRSGRTLANRGPDLMNGHGDCVAGLGPFDPDRAGHGITVRHRHLVSAVAVGPDLAGEGVFRLNRHRLAGLDPQARLNPAVEHIEEWPDGQAFHGHSLRISLGEIRVCKIGPA